MENFYKPKVVIHLNTTSPTHKHHEMLSNALVFENGEVQDMENFYKRKPIIQINTTTSPTHKDHKMLSNALVFENGKVQDQPNISRVKSLQQISLNVVIKYLYLLESPLGCPQVKCSKLSYKLQFILIFCFYLEIVLRFQ